MLELNVDGAPIDALIEGAKRAEREGDLETALRRYESALHQLPADAPPGTSADLLRWIGSVRRMREEVEPAREAYEASLALAEQEADDARVAAALNCLGVIEQFGGSLESAEALYQRGRESARRAGADSLLAMLDQNIATLANIRGDIEEALASYSSALDRLLELGQEDSAASVLNNMGMAHVDTGGWDAAAECFDRAYQLADGLQDAALLAVVDLNRAELYFRQDRLREARETCDRAFETYSRIGSDAGRGEALKLYGSIAREGDKPHQARDHFRAAFDLARQCGDLLLEAEIEAERAVLFLATEENPDALRSLNRAHRLFAELQAQRELFDLDRRLDRLEETYLEVVSRWAVSIEEKDEYTAGHCQRVADYGCLLASAVGIKDRDLVWFRMGGFLHDVGKIEVPDTVLNKPGKLTDEEWMLMKGHAAAGDMIVRDLNFPWEIAPIVRSHHERWDGTGYPDGLVGEEIPLTARILCLADVYDALTTARSYRGALPHEEAMGIMTRDAGKAFDPELFKLFRRLIETYRSAPVAAEA